MEFQSILGITKKKPIASEDLMMPGYFYDLNLDQIVQDIMDHQKLYDIRRFYFERAEQPDIEYRMEVMKDLDQEKVFLSVQEFAIGMRKAKEYLNNIAASKVPEQRRKWKLDAAFFYARHVRRFFEELKKAELKSRGMTLFREWLGSYIQSEDFRQLESDSRQLTAKFDEMKFHLKIKRDRIIIDQRYIEDDYGQKLQEIFKKQAASEHYYQNNPFGTVTLSALEEEVLKVLRKPYAEIFKELSDFDGLFHDFISSELSTFELEIQFYVAFRLYRDEMKSMSFHFCYPKLCEEEFRILEGYDLALARKNSTIKKEVVYNDCTLNKGEQFLIITGPNQGGKTTYARALGQILYFGTLGLMVPALEASFPLFDHIVTHFASEESVETGAGKLKEELLRLKKLMDQVTKHSFVIINEIFTSATSYDAYIMGKRVLEYFLQADCLGIYVTHIYELTKEEERIVSMVATLSSEDENIRTFKIERRNADGRSFSNTIVEKYHMTYEKIKERLIL